MTATALIRTRLLRPRYSLATLLGVVTAICAALGFWNWREREYRERLAAVEFLSEVRVQRGNFDPDPLAGILLRQWGRSLDRLRRGDVVTYARVGSWFDQERAAIRRLRSSLRAFDATRSDIDLGELAKLTSLEWLNLSGKPVGDDGLRKLAPLRKLRELDLSHTNISGDGFAGLSGLKKLEKLNLGDTNLNDDGARHLSALPSLRTLYLSKTKITDAGLGYLSSLPSLEDLGLTATDISDAGIRHLARLRSLRKLHLYKTKVCGRGFAEFGSTAKLELLDAQWTPLGDEGVRQLARLRSLRYLNLSDTRISDDAAPQLRHLTGLEDLNLFGCAIGDRSLPYLGELRRLKVLTLGSGLAGDGWRPRPHEELGPGRGITDEGLKALRQLDSLERLDVRSCHISDAAIVDIGAMKSLNHVHLPPGPQITSAAVARLRRMKPKLEVFWSDASWLDEESMEVEGAEDEPGQKTGATKRVAPG